MGTNHVLSVLDEAGEVRLKAVSGSGGSAAAWQALLEGVRDAQVFWHDRGGIRAQPLFDAMEALLHSSTVVVQELRDGRVWMLGHEDAEEGEWMDALAEVEECLALPYIGEEYRAQLRGQAEWGYPSVDKFRQWDWNPRWRYGTASRTAHITHDGLLFTTEAFEEESDG